MYFLFAGLKLRGDRVKKINSIILKIIPILSILLFSVYSHGYGDFDQPNPNEESPTVNLNVDTDWDQKAQECRRSGGTWFQSMYGFICESRKDITESPPSRTEDGSQIGGPELPAVTEEAAAEAARKQAAEEAAARKAAEREATALVGEIEEQFNACREAADNAQKCCGNPLECLGVPKEVAEISGMLSQIALGFGAAKTGEKGIAKYCKFFKKVGYTASAISASSAALCTNKQLRCSRTCKGIKSDVVDLLEQCEYTNRSATCRSLRNLKSRANVNIDSCRGLTLNITAKVDNAIQSFSGAKQSELCQKAAEGEEKTAAPEPDQTFEHQSSLNMDCSNPANATSPICQFNCQRPGAENDPLCRNLNDDSDDDSEISDVEMDPQNELTDDVDLGLGDEEEQFPVFPKVAPQPNQVVSTPGAGGGAPPSGGAAGGPTGYNPASGNQQGRRSKGYNTKIFKGTRSLTGYSRKYTAGGGGGGFRGYGSGYRGGQNGRKVSGRKFDLRKFLPGGKKGPKRGIASLSRPGSQQIGGKHTDIWQKITNRYHGICRVGRLQGCGRR